MIATTRTSKLTYNLANETYSVTINDKETSHTKIPRGVLEILMYMKYHPDCVQKYRCSSTMVSKVDDPLFYVSIADVKHQLDGDHFGVDPSIFASFLREVFIHLQQTYI